MRLEPGRSLSRVDIVDGERATGGDVAADHADVFGDRTGPDEITAASLVPLIGDDDRSRWCRRPSER